MPPKTKAKAKGRVIPKGRVGCVRFNELIGSMHLTSPHSVVAHETDVVHYAAVIPCCSAKEARGIVTFMNARNHGATDFAARNDNGHLIAFARFSALGLAKR